MARQPPLKHCARYYVTDNGDVIRRINGVDEIVLLDAPQEVWDRLAIQGYVQLRTLGKSHDDILTGRGIPSRTLPSTPADVWLQAIAEVRGKQVAEERSAAAPGSLIKISEIAADARKWAADLTPLQQRRLRKNVDVQIAYARITGADTPFAQLLAS